MTPRRAAVLAVNLPSGAETWQQADIPNGWTAAEHLLAGAIDVLRVGNWQRGGDPKAPRPDRLPRPGDATREAEREDRMTAKALAFQRRAAARKKTEGV